MSFESQYYKNLARLNKISSALSDYTEFILKDSRILFHDVAFRIKSLDSASKKIQTKGYDDPWEQIMDFVAGRVFTYFKEDSLLVESVIREHFVVDEHNSINKAAQLRHDTFGYTSRHLICSASDKTQNLELKSLLQGLKFELQIRTVLEHGWAEIEHELVYKSGTMAPDPIRRRFAASAASLELIEGEFSQLRSYEKGIIEQRVLAVDSSLDQKLDRAWLIASLEKHYSNRQTWDPNPQHDNFYHGQELVILNLLQSHNISTLRDWNDILCSSKLKNEIDSYAHANNLQSIEVNHLAIALLACISIDGVEIDGQISELIGDDIKAIL